MKFCSDCGAEVDFRIPEGDNRPRYLCDDCGSIHYQNPRIVAGCIPEWDSRILLCRRAIEPRYGLWTLPAGFMENGETVEAAASRETEEEACAKVKLDGLYCICNIPHVHQVYMIFRGQVINGHFEPGPESLETALFSEADIPWKELAFPVVERTLHRYFKDRLTGRFDTYLDTITRPTKRPL